MSKSQTSYKVRVGSNRIRLARKVSLNKALTARVAKPKKKLKKDLVIVFKVSARTLEARGIQYPPRMKSLRLKLKVKMLIIVKN
jgi:hypothetical protein